MICEICGKKAEPSELVCSGCGNVLRITSVNDKLPYCICGNPEKSSVDISFGGQPLPQEVRNALARLRLEWDDAERVWHSYGLTMDKLESAMDSVLDGSMEGLAKGGGTKYDIISTPGKMLTITFDGEPSRDVKYALRRCCMARDKDKDHCWHGGFDISEGELEYAVDKALDGRSPAPPHSDKYVVQQDVLTGTLSVEFEDEPPVAVRDALREMGMKYDRFRYLWTGGTGMEEGMMAVIEEAKKSQKPWHEWDQYQ